MDKQTRETEAGLLKMARDHHCTFYGDVQIKGPSLTGLHGQVLQRELNVKFNPDPIDPTNQQLCRWFKRSYHHMKRVASAVSVAHRKPVKIDGGSLTSWDPWSVIRSSVLNLDRHFARKGAAAIGMGSCAIRPTWDPDPDVPPSIAVVSRANYSVYTRRSNPYAPVVVIQRQHLGYDWLGQTHRYWIWDLRDLKRPRYIITSSEAGFWSDYGRYQFELKGDLYPWKMKDGQPFI